MKANGKKLSQTGKVLYDYPDIGTEAKGTPRLRDRVRAAKRTTYRKGIDMSDPKDLEEKKKMKMKERFEKMDKSMGPDWGSLIKGTGTSPEPGGGDDGSKTDKGGKDKKGKKKTENPQYSPEVGNVDLGTQGPVMQGADGDGLNPTLPGAYSVQGAGPDSVSPTVREVSPVGTFGKSTAAYGTWVEHDEPVAINTPYGVQNCEVVYMAGTLLGKSMINTPQGQQLVDIQLPANPAAPAAGSPDAPAEDAAPVVSEAMAAMSKSMGRETVKKGSYFNPKADEMKKKKEAEDAKKGMQVPTQTDGGALMRGLNQQQPATWVDMLKSQSAHTQYDPNQQVGFESFDASTRARYNQASQNQNTSNQQGGY